MTEAAPTLLYLGCAALLIAAVLLRLPAKMRVGLFTTMILAAILGGPGQQVERATIEIIAMK
jgi:hypothetical protein